MSLTFWPLLGTYSGQIEFATNIRAAPTWDKSAEQTSRSRKGIETLPEASSPAFANRPRSGVVILRWCSAFGAFD
jgi:hypothetical protein